MAAEISAAQNISRGRAGNQIRLARALRDDLPAVAKVFATGVIDYRMVAMIITRTENVDQSRARELDTAIARHCVKWMRFSKPKLRDRIDQWVTKFDPLANRVPPVIRNGRCIEVGETSAMAGIWGNVDAADGAQFDAKLDALAATVCDNDPRTHEQRRADALGPVSRYEATLPCRCGLEDCPVLAERKALSDVVIHVLAEQATLEGTSDQPGYLPGFGILPAESVRDLADSDATVKPLAMPGEEAAPGYRPTTAQAAFVRWRDLTCRFPGCDKPVQACDIDHTTPYPYGATHPSDIKLYCRTDHLLKTFYAGFGWTDCQLPDGTVCFASPTGHTYTTEAHGGALFPALAQPTADLGEAATVSAESPHCNVMMPTRRQTREQDRQDRITKERRERKEINRQEERQRQAWLAAIYEPPPF